jgi:hypothetical protein
LIVDALIPEIAGAYSCLNRKSQYHNPGACVVRIPVQFFHPFRFRSSTDSGLDLPVNPV